MKIFQNINQISVIFEPQTSPTTGERGEKECENLILRHNFVDPKMMIKFSQIFTKYLAKRFINLRNVFLISRKSYFPQTPQRKRSCALNCHAKITPRPAFISIAVD
jgi:hypothetical protein